MEYDRALLKGLSTKNVLTFRLLAIFARGPLLPKPFKVPNLEHDYLSIGNDGKIYWLMAIIQPQSQNSNPR
jgi:hypothetical protein